MIELDLYCNYNYTSLYLQYIIDDARVGSEMEDKKH